MASWRPLDPLDTDMRYVQARRLPSELETRILEITSPIGQTSQVVSIPDNEKRWAIVGIVLNGILAPALRKFVEPEMQKLYTSLKQSHSIDNQPYNSPLLKYKQKKLNYQAVNHGKTVANYNYQILDHVELSKLFLVPHMARFSGFDDSCDASAVLGLMINVPYLCSATVVAATEDMRNTRNDWAHCNRTEWDASKYQRSFSSMETLIRSLQLPDEKEILQEINLWELKGLKLIHDTYVEDEILKAFREETSLLANYALECQTINDDERKVIYKHVSTIETELNQVCENISILGNRQDRAEERLESVEYGETTLSNTIGRVQNVIEDTLVDIMSVKSTQAELAEESRERISVIETKQAKITNRIEEITKALSEVQVKICTTAKRPENAFFHAPDRNKLFTGRKLVMAELAHAFHVEKQLAVAISGLGGCGKTTVAAEYAWLYQEVYKGGVFWISAENDVSIVSSINSLAVNADIESQDSQEKLLKVLKWLSSIDETCLMVIDNADQAKVLPNSLLKTLLHGTWRHHSKCQLLVTTRREPKEIMESMCYDEGQCLSLGMMTSEEAVEFMEKRTDKSSDDNLRRLVEAIGGLPLALEQAAAHISAVSFTYEEYIRKYEKQKVKVLSRIARSTDTYISSDRLSVQTTWQMNIDYIQQHSQEKGYGNTAVLIMDMAAYLFADDIPIELINVGEPPVEDSELQDALTVPSDAKELTEVLTRFSLFSRGRSNSGLAVHRLVQEIIQSKHDLDRQLFLLQSCVKVVHCSLQNIEKPQDILTSSCSNHLGSIQLWDRIAINACSLQLHLSQLLSTYRGKSNAFLNIETACIMQTAAFHYSINLQQSEAQSSQSSMLDILCHADGLTEETHKQMTLVTIPFLEKERLLLQKYIVPPAAVLGDISDKSTLDSDQISNQRELLKLKGNEAFRNKSYHEATKCYTQAINVNKLDGSEVDYTLFSNRSLCFIRMKNYPKALSDANECIACNPHFHEGHVNKALAIAYAIGMKSKEFYFLKTSGLASAALAAYLHPACNTEYEMKVLYPINVYKVITNPLRMQAEIETLWDKPFITLLLPKGFYNCTHVILCKSIQIIGIEDGVNISVASGMAMSWEDTKETNISLHFENITFPANASGISVQKNVTATFYRCKLSNGISGCEDYPNCKGGEGCRNRDGSRDSEHNATVGIHERSFGPEKIMGIGGCPGVQAYNGGIVYIEQCIIDHCGGGGVLSYGLGSFVKVSNCVVQNHRQMGLEATHDGILHAIRNRIINNISHGIALDAAGPCILQNNVILDNQGEGILVSIKTQHTDIIDNEIGQNGKCGISMDGGISARIEGNRIFKNWCWAILIKSKSNVQFINNEVFDNKCGGVRLMMNYSARIYLDANTIRDHSGPDFFSEAAMTRDVNITHWSEAEKLFGRPKEELYMYNASPIITKRNICRRNNTGQGYPKEDDVKIIWNCAYCGNTTGNFGVQLKKCANCNHAFYCSKSCQSNHWRKHKVLCKALSSEFTVKLQMNKVNDSRKRGVFRHFNAELKGIGKGPAPNRQSSQPFVVKIQSGNEYENYNPQSMLTLYDQSTKLDIMFISSDLYHLIRECGVLGTNQITSKKVFCIASFQKKGSELWIYTDKFAPKQEW